MVNVLPAINERSVEISGFSSNLDAKRRVDDLTIFADLLADF